MQPVKHLYSEFIPHHYTLELELDREKRTFSGTASISGESAHGIIAVHAKELTISSITVDNHVAEFTPSENDEIEIIYPNKSAGLHTVVITYSGTITDSLHGLYPCHFNVEGEDKELLVTQFESHYAREVFPCIDEPQAKATFDVTVTTEDGVTVLGNMPTKTHKMHDGKLTTVFETTPKMSTYLLALVVGELQSLSATTKNGIEVSVWSTKSHKSNQLAYALDSAVKCIEFFDEYFGVLYPLPKADHVAVPDFDAGAMENWGLITYRESALLIDPDNSSLPSRQYVTSVVAHELSHQWFGNLVTMKWWNNLWLNESFASIMENVAPHSLHPEWNVWLDFSTHDGIAAARRDAIDGVQAVQTDVNHPDEISSLFDGAIVYAKGARLMRMCEAYIGEDAFRGGLKTYFMTHAYGNTDENDLWKALSASSGKDVGNFMNAWISQSGYPVVNAELDGASLTLTQSQFFVGAHAESKKLWPIPLDANINSLPENFSKSHLTLSLTDFEYLLLNQHDSAHYIVNYDGELLSRLIDAIKAGKISEIGRLKIIHERVMLARAGAVDPSSLIDLLSAYQNESSEPVWEMISLAIGELKKFVDSDSAEEKKLRTFVGELSKKQYDRLGWHVRDGEPVNDTKLRPGILSHMLYAEDSSAIHRALELAQSSAIENLPADIRSLLLGARIKYDHDEMFVEELIKRYSSEASPEIKDDIRAALTSAKDQPTIKKLLELLTDKSYVRPQDTLHWYIYLLSNRHARTATWQWLRSHWNWIEETFGSDKSFDYYPRYSGQILSNRREAEEYRDFFSPMRSDIALKRTIEMGLLDVESRVDLIEKYSGSVRAHLLDL